MRGRVLTAVAAAAIGLSAMTGTAAAAEDVEVCRKIGANAQICVRVLESGALVGVTYCNGFFCIHRDVPQPASAIGDGAMTGTAAAADDVQVCRNVGRGHVCVRALETGAVVGVTICQGVSCIEYNVPQPI